MTALLSAAMQSRTLVAYQLYRLIFLLPDNHSLRLRCFLIIIYSFAIFISKVPDTHCSSFACPFLALSHKREREVPKQDPETNLLQ